MRRRLSTLFLLPLLTGCIEEVVAPEPAYPQRFAEVAAGDAHTCATTTAGRTFCWGNPAQARLGHIGQAMECDPVGCRAPVPIRDNYSFDYLAAGEAHTCGLVDGRAYCWGFNRFGQLGDDASVFTNCWDDLPFRCSIDPWRVAVGLPLSLITAARMHTCALADDGRALCWGWNIAGQLGRAFKDDDPHPEPSFVEGGHTFFDLATAGGHTCGIALDETAYCWGWNPHGNLGTGDRVERHVPTAVVGGHHFRQIAPGGFFTCAIDTMGQVWCWGWGAYGHLGNFRYDDHLEPTPAYLPEPATHISAGLNHTCAIGVSGNLYCWGRNDRGQLGAAARENNPTPQNVPLPDRVTRVSVGALHTCAITADDRLYCWGDNSRRQLGFGLNAFRDTPMPVNP